MRYLLSPFSTLLFIIPILVNSLIDRPFSSKNDLEELRPFIDAPVTGATESSSLMCVCDRMADSMALVALYNSTDGANWLNSWDLMQPMDTWYGVLLNSDGCVQCLDLDGNYGSNFPDCVTSGDRNELHGTLPDELGNLTCIEVLIITDNNQSNRILSGPIPNSLGNLTFLKKLYLYNNRLTGVIPSSFSNLTNLEELFLYGNEDGGNSGGLSGEVPALSLPSLIDLRLFQNNFSSINPAFLSSANLPVIEVFGLSNNQLTNIPPELGDLTSLVDLYLYDQKLEGTSSVTTLTGSIPANLGNLSNLATLRLEDNDLTGCIPEELQMLCSTVTNGNLTNNPNLATQSWSDFCNGQTGMCCTHPDKVALKAFYEAMNGGGWMMGWDTSNCDVCNWYGILCNGNNRVQIIDLDGHLNYGTSYSSVPQGNNLSGIIPPQIGDLVSLEKLILDVNVGITGAIPLEISNLINLTLLNIRGCNLDGEIPNSIGDLQNLERIDLENNNIPGEIPSTIGNLSALQELRLCRNDFTGQIPSTIGQLSNLTYLSICNNPGTPTLTGPIPSSIGQLNNLDLLIISSTGLTGGIPPEIGQLQALTYLSFVGNSNLGENLPSQLFSMASLEFLRINGCGITGTIDPNISLLTNVWLLELENNFLEGEIPEEIGDMNLSVLGLMNNNLSGCIPENLQNLCSSVTFPQVLYNNPNLTTQYWSDFCNLGSGSCGCPPAGTSSIEVINTNDSGYGSLRQAIECANADPALDNINFNIPGAGPHVISITSNLPSLTDNGINIDATTQPSWGYGEIVLTSSNSFYDGIKTQLNGGSNATIKGIHFDGLNFGISLFAGADNVIISENVFSNNSVGFSIVDATGTQINNNRVGTNASGTTLASNTDFGAILNFGCTNAVVSNNVFASSPGVVAFEVYNQGHQITNNIFGLDPTGTFEVGLGSAMLVTNDAVDIVVSNNIIGYAADHAINVLSGAEGVLISQNSIFCNGNPSVALLISGVPTATITTASTNELAGISGANSTIELFLHDETGCAGAPCQGKTYLGQTTSDAAGNWTYPNPSVSVGDEITATATDAGNNTSAFSACATVIVPCPTITASLTNDGPICEGETVTLTFAISGGTTPYQVTFNDGSVSETLSSPTNTLTVQYSPAANTTYTLESITDDDGCVENFSNVNTVVTVNALPTVSLGPDPVICEGETLMLSATSPTATNYSWSGPNNYSSNQQNPSIPNATPAESGDYSVTVTDNNGCTASALLVALVHPIPASIAGSNSPVCVGQSLDLTESGGNGTGWSWTGPNGFSSSDQNPVINPVSLANAGDYTVTVTDGNNCSSTATINVIVNELPNVPGAISGLDVVCAGDIEMYSIAPVAGATMYSWILPTGANVVGANDGDQIQVDWTNASSGDLCVASVNNCGTSSTSCLSVQVDVIPGQPGAIFGDLIVCEGTTTPYFVQPIIGIINYHWTLPLGASITGQSNSSGIDIDWTGAVSGDLCLEVENNCGTGSPRCIGITVDPILQTPGPISGNSAVCEGAIEIYSVPPDPAALDYNWTVPMGATIISGQNSEAITVSFSGAVTGEICVVTLNDCGMSFPAACLPVSGGVPPLAVSGSNTPVCEGFPLTLFETGGEAVQWVWSGPNGFSAVIQNPIIGSPTLLATGDYFVTITDANGCTNSASTNVVINAEPAVVAISNSPICTGENINMEGQGAANLTWSWSGPGGFSSSEQNPVITNATSANAGTYTVTVTDVATSCTNTANVQVVVNALPSLTASNNGPACEGETVSLFGSGGSGTWEWSGPNGFMAVGQNVNIPNATSSEAGTYTLTLVATNGCINTVSTNVLVNEIPTILNIQSTDVSCFGGSDGVINIDLTGGGQPYSYTWSPSNGSGGNPNINLVNGNYTVTITTTDGCSTTSTATVSEPNQLIFGCAQYSPVTTNGGNDGVGLIQFFGGTIPYAYTYTGPVNGNGTVNHNDIELIGALEEGSYSLEVIDGNGCMQTCSFIISGPACAGFVLNSIVPNPTSCHGGDDGSIELDFSGGVLPFTFDWSGGSIGNVEDPNGLLAGNYSVTATDSDGCSFTASTTVTQPNEMSLTCGEQAPVSTNGGNDGIAGLTLGGGTMPYDYGWTGPSSDTIYNVGVGAYTISDLVAGVYQVTLTDANACTANCTFEITEPSCGLSLDELTAQAASCAGGNNGSIALTLSGGVQPYIYLWSDPSQNGVEDPTDLSAGTYSVTVLDAVGCSVMGSVTVGEPPALQLDCMQQSPVSSSGNSDGTASIQFEGGTAPYGYSWDGPLNGSGTSPSAATILLSNLLEGTYGLTLTDDNGCTLTCSFTIDGPGCTSFNISNTVLQNVSCNGANDGSIDITVTGGILPLDYMWNLPALNGMNMLSNLAPGIYDVTASDATGCTATGSYTIEEPASLQLSCSEQLAVSAIGNSDGEALITYGGGTPTYDYNWTGPTSGNGSGAGGMVVLDNLPEGNYSLTLTDGNLCEEICAFEITVAAPPTCRQLDSMMLVTLYNATHENGPWTNEWDLMQPMDTWYGIDLNANGCVSCIDLDGVEDCGAGISAGGNNLMGALPDLVFSELQLLSFHENNLAGPIPQLTMPNLLSLGLGHCQLNGGIPVFDFPELLYLALCCNELTGGIPNMDFPNLIGLYLHENQLTGNLPLQLTNLTNMQFLNLSVNQLEGCFPPSYDIFCDIDYSFVGNPDLPGGGDFDAFCADGTGACSACSIDAYVSVTNTSCGQPNGSATVVIIGGSGNYTFLWSNGATTQTITDLEMGTYSVTITDGNCQSVVSGIVGFVEKPVIEWERNYGGSESDVAFSIQETADRGFVIVGGSWSNDGDVGSNKGESDTWIIKINQDGDLEWEKSFGGADRDYAESIQHTKDGGFIVANATMSNDGDVSVNKGGFDYWIFKIDQDGNLLWEKTYGGSGSDEIYSIRETQDGGYILGGHTISSDGDVGGNNGGYDYWVVKLNQNGAVEWEQNFGGTDTEFMFSINQTLDGGYVAAGWSESSDNDVGGNYGMRDYWIVKMNAIGTIEWERNFGGASMDVPNADNAIQITKDGGFIISGGSRSSDGDVTGNNGGYDYWVIKLNNDGILEWENNYGGTFGDQATGIVVIDDGGYVVAGSSSSSNGDVTDNFGDADCWIIKLDQDGSLIWNLNVGGSGRDNARFAKQTTDGKYITVGFSESNDGNVGGNNGSFDYWIVKLGPPHFPTTALGNDTTICQMEMVELFAFDSLCTTCTYLWNDGNTNPVRMVSPMQTTEYTVTLTDANGCTDSDTIMVSVNSLSVDLGDDVSACELPELDAGPAEFYGWSTGETSQTIQPMQAGEYAVTITDLLGCTAADTISLAGLTVGDASIDTVLCLADVFVFNGKMYEQSGIYADTLKSVGDCDSIITQIVLEISNLNLDIGADIEACDLANNPVVLDAGIADFYSWSNGATSGTIQVNMPGTYACTVTDDLGCTKEDAVEVVEIPAFEITIDTAICTGESIIVGASTYSSTGNYTEQLTSVANCDSIVYLNLTVLPSLTQPAISGASEVCSGEAAIYQITNYDPALIYGWDLPNDATLLNNSGGQAEIQFGSLSGEVTVSVSNSCETVSSDVIIVAVGQATLPAPVFTGDTTVCEGETIVYQIASFDPASTYDWALPNGAVIVAENGPDVSIQFAGNGGALSLTETNNCGESTAYPVVINVGNAPTITLPINGDVLICGSETATYSTGSVTGALAYQWTVSPGAFTQTTNSPTLDMDWALPGMYSLCVVAENDCGVSIQPQCLTVNVLELPQGQISGDTVLCGSGEVTLTFDLQGTGPWDITYSSGSTAFDVFGIPSSPHTIVQPVSMPTTFELIKVQNENGCIGTATGTFEVSIGQQTDIGIDTVLCSGEEIIIDGIVYADSGCFEMTLPAMVGCDTVLTLCIDDADPFELLQVKQCEVPYIFNGKEIYDSGIYEDTILHSGTCSTFVVLDLEILSSADFEPVPDTLTILNGSNTIDINLVANDMLPDSAFWYLNILSQPNNGVVNDIGNGTVSLTVTNSAFSGNDLFSYAICMDECPDTCKATSVLLTFIDDCLAEIAESGNIPKAFSPNGDGINDYFDPIQEFKDQQCPFLEGEEELLILNRWGEVVYQPSPYIKWDGKRNLGDSKPFPPATYYYVLKIIKLNGEEVIVKGPISIYEK